MGLTFFPNRLVYAFLKYNLNLVKLLIDNGIDVNAKCNGFCFDAAVQAGNSIVKLDS